MKRLFVILAVAAVALVSCKKEETKFAEEANREISFKAVTNLATKAGELDGTTMDDKGYVIYAAASQYMANGVLENGNFFAYEPFQATAGTAPNKEWHHVAAENLTPTVEKIYWPVGGAKMDFLAYALPIGKNRDFTDAPKFAPNVVADSVFVTKWDTFAKQIDLLYAAANGQTSKANGADPYVKMEFKHAQALLIFNVKASEAVASAGTFSILRICFVEDPYATLKGTLVTSGDFVVDNSRNELKAFWRLDAPGDDFIMPRFASTPGTVSPCNTGISRAVNYGDPIENYSNFFQLGETLLIPEQPRQNFTIFYNIGGNNMKYTYNIERGTWEMGKKYIYNLDFNVNEIIITETVEDFKAVADAITIE